MLWHTAADQPRAVDGAHTVRARWPALVTARQAHLRGTQ
jgi:hypothetical protein